MDTTILQVPIKKTLRDRATKVATEAGFSSLQEAVRVLLTHMSERQLKVSFEHPPVKLSPKADRRYNKMIADVESGKVKPKRFTPKDSIDDIMNWLNS